MSDSAPDSRRAALHVRLNIQPGVPAPQEVVELCHQGRLRNFPGLLPHACDRGLSLRPGWVVPFYMAIESLQSALTAQQRRMWLPVGLLGCGWQLSFPERRTGDEKQALPPALGGIERQYRARVLNTCATCGGAGQLYPEREGLLRDVLCKKCAAPRQLMVGLSQLCDPVWAEADGMIHLERPKLPSPWCQGLLRWSIGSGISPMSITPALYEDWIAALLPAAQEILKRGRANYHDAICDGMVDICSRLSKYIHV